MGVTLFDWSQVWIRFLLQLWSSLKDAVPYVLQVSALIYFDFDFAGYKFPLEVLLRDHEAGDTPEKAKAPGRQNSETMCSGAEGWWAEEGLKILRSI